MRVLQHMVIPVITVLAVIVGVSGSAAAAAKPSRGGSIIWSLTIEPAAFDPRVGVNQNSGVQTVLDSLAVVDPGTQQVVPRIAQSISVNGSNTVWTIKLRPNVQFTDGTPFDAGAIKADWDRLKDPATGATIRSTLEQYGTWAVKDPLTFVVTLPKPIGSFANSLADVLGAIPSPTAVAKYGSTFGSSPQTTVGAGPFVLKEWVHNDHLTETRNPNYWNKGRPYLDQITFKAIADPSTKADALLTKTINLGYFSAPDMSLTRLTSGGLHETKTTILTSYGAEFNPSKAPFDDIRVRQALVLATDTKDVNLKATGGLGELSGGAGSAWYPKSSPFYDPSVVQKTNNLAAAQKLIDAYVAEKGPVRFSLLEPASTVNLGTALIQTWSRLNNVTITANPQSNTQAILLLNQGNFTAMAVTSPPGGPWSFPDQYYNVLGTGASANVIKYSDSQFDKLIQDGYGVTDVAHRKLYLNKMGQILINDAIFDHVYWTVYYYFATSNVHNLDLLLTNGHPDAAALWVSSK